MLSWLRKKQKQLVQLCSCPVIYAVPRVTTYLYKWWFYPTRWNTAASRHEDFKNWLARNFGIGETTLEKYQRMGEEGNGSTFADLERIMVEDESEGVNESD